MLYLYIKIAAAVFLVATGAISQTMRPEFPDWDWFRVVKFSAAFSFVCALIWPIGVLLILIAVVDRRKR